MILPPLFVLVAALCLPPAGGASMKLPLPRALVKPDHHHQHQQQNPIGQSESLPGQRFPVIEPYSPQSLEGILSSRDSYSGAHSTGGSRMNTNSFDDDDWRDFSVAGSGSGRLSGAPPPPPLLKRINAAGLKMFFAVACCCGEAWAVWTWRCRPPLPPPPPRCCSYHACSCWGPS